MIAKAFKEKIALRDHLSTLGTEGNIVFLFNFVLFWEFRRRAVKDEGL